MSRQSAAKGIYSLLIRVPQRTTIDVGGLGKRRFSAGLYVYTGSALNSLFPRISRHLASSKKKRWHIDYLTSDPRLQIVGVAWRLTTRRLECSTARRIGTAASGLEKGFGCGDCGCESHLHYFREMSSVRRTLSEAGLPYFLGGKGWPPS